ncbi:hypothetical protein MSPP1_002574 [Malassezia sp. CBS 17886]|nr:hypothetical protein MSPP1_002574 [Malassezia sp. CBS 17886]
MRSAARVAAGRRGVWRSGIVGGGVAGGVPRGARHAPVRAYAVPRVPPAVPAAAPACDGAALRGIPRDVPLADLSLRSLMDYCVGRTRWRVLHREAAALTDLPLLDAREAQAVAATLAGRGVPSDRFILWYNAMTRTSWSSSAALLDALPCGRVPPFVLQRALTKVASLADTASAVATVDAHASAYTVDQLHRLAQLLVRTCLREQRAWHVAARVADRVLHTAALWRSKKQSRQPARAADLRARRAFLRALAFARAHDGELLSHVAQQIVRTERMPRGARRAADAFLTVPLMRVLLEGVDGGAERELLAVGVRVAATQGDAEVARSPHPGDVAHSWALFDELCGEQRARGGDAPVSGARFPDWALMLRAAAGDTRIDTARVLALLKLRDRDTPPADMARMAASWHCPPATQAKLRASVAAYSSVMDGFLARGDLARAAAVWDASVRRGVAPDAWALTSLCKVYFRAGLPGRALESVVQWCYSGGALGADERDGSGLGAGATRPLGAEAARPLGNENHPAKNVAAPPRAIPPRADAAPASTSVLRIPRELGGEYDAEPALQEPRRRPPHAAAAAPSTPRVPPPGAAPYIAAPRHPRTHHIRATTFLVNTLFEGLLHAHFHETLFYLWRTMRQVLPVPLDVASVDLLLRSACTMATQKHPVEPYAIRELFRRALLRQHPELQTCANPLESAAHRGWLLRSEMRLRRLERWLGARVHALLGGLGGPPAAPAPVDDVLAPIHFDARLFHRYCELLYALLHVPEMPTVLGVAGGAPHALAAEVCEELALVLAWMRALDLVPQRATLCLACATLEETLPPGASAAPLRAWLVAWLGEGGVPDDGEMGAWVRGLARRGAVRGRERRGAVEDEGGA